ncbi:hypothetical protein AYI68_g4088 [Smittium mucronatum]|uniref:Uncharacterized protein n=1 Tax=Smittium mucronatum TaxID=133383 RepID=A0A1R0GY21_9FUNG|nr:hypothetical protein AYI68_g4088 [Smittium mucronatum]
MRISSKNSLGSSNDGLSSFARKKRWVSDLASDSKRKFTNLFKKNKSNDLTSDDDDDEDYVKSLGLITPLPKKFGESVVVTDINTEEKTQLPRNLHYSTNLNKNVASTAVLKFKENQKRARMLILRLSLFPIVPLFTQLFQRIDMFVNGVRIGFGDGNPVDPRSDRIAGIFLYFMYSLQGSLNLIIFLLNPTVLASLKLIFRQFRNTDLGKSKFKENEFDFKMTHESPPANDHRLNINGKSGKGGHKSPSIESNDSPETLIMNYILKNSYNKVEKSPRPKRQEEIKKAETSNSYKKLSFDSAELSHSYDNVNEYNIDISSINTSQMNSPISNSELDDFATYGGKKVGANPSQDNSGSINDISNFGMNKKVDPKGPKWFSNI